MSSIGSEGYEAVRLGRKFIGIELKRSYYDVMVRNLKDAAYQSNAIDLFSLAGVEI